MRVLAHVRFFFWQYFVLRSYKLTTTNMEGGDGMFLLEIEAPRSLEEFGIWLLVGVLVVGGCYAFVYFVRAISGKEERDACEEEE